MKRLCGFLAAILCCSVPILHAQEAAAEDRLIRQTVRDISGMWTREDGQQTAERILAEKFVYIAPNGVLNKKEFGAFLATFYRNNQPQSHTHAIYRILLKGNHAYEYGAVEIVLKNGNRVGGEILNIFVKEQDAWRLLVSLPCDAIRETLKQ